VYTYTDYSDGGASALAFLLLVVPFILFLAVIGYVISSFFLMKIFEKAGVQGKWRAWVPVYNTLIFVKLGDLNPWWLLILWAASAVLGWIPVIGGLFGLAAFVYTMLAAWRVGLKLQKEPVWLILYFFLAIVWLGINAFDKSRWNPAIAPAPWAGNFLADNTVWSGIPAQQSSVGYAGPGGGQPGGYPAPPQGYQQPPQGYQQPPQGYQQPPQGYQPPPPTAGASPAATPAPPLTTPPATTPDGPAAGSPPPVAPPTTDPDAPRTL
jgi:hypothetical protein